MKASKFKLFSLATALSISASANALTFDFTFLSTSTAQANNAFTQAGAIWSSWLTDDVTIKLQVGTATLGTGILAEAGSTRGVTSYENYKSHLIADTRSAADVIAVSNLAPGSSFGMLINRTFQNSLSSTPYLDNNGSANNQSIRLNFATAKALGYGVTYDASNPYDGKITFSDLFSWDYDGSNGIASNQFDFVGIAVHEIGHALGFTSGVDVLDYNGSSAYSENAYTWVSPLDLYRYSADSASQGVIDWTADKRYKYFSIDGGVTDFGGLSTGQKFGNGRQASHWLDNMDLGIMDPTAGMGELLSLDIRDLLAMDVIGWDIAQISNVPEPTSLALLGLGLAGIGFSRRKKQ